MNRNMVLAEWNRARESLRAAETLTRDRCYADAISRCYYAILHAAKAALQVHDIDAESHPAVRRMFGLHLVKAGEIESEWSAYLTDNRTPRHAARLKTVRPKLLALLKDFESHSERQRRSGEVAYDLTWMWAELGLKRE